MSLYHGSALSIISELHHRLGSDMLLSAVGTTDQESPHSLDSSWLQSVGCLPRGLCGSSVLAEEFSVFERTRSVTVFSETPLEWRDDMNVSSEGAARQRLLFS